MKRLKGETVGKTEWKEREDLFEKAKETNTMKLYLKRIDKEEKEKNVNDTNNSQTVWR